MRRTLLMVLLLAAIQTASAQRNVGVGIFLGAPTGFTVKFPTTPSASVDILLAWNIENTFFAQGQYDYKITTLRRTSDAEIGLYGGPGVFFRAPERHEGLFGFSGNFGINWITNTHVEFFSEISPKIGIIRTTEFDLTGGIGFRYLF